MTAATPAATLSVRRMGMLFVATACNLAIWILVGLYATSEFYRRSLVKNGVVPWNEVLDFQMVSALNWALLTPLVVFIAERLPLRDEHRIRNGIAVIVFLPYLAVFRAAWGGAVLNLGEHDPIDLGMINLSIGIRTHRYSAILAVDLLRLLPRGRAT